MITLNNGAKVLAFKGRAGYGREWHGVVVADTGREYVTWRVSSFDDGQTWDAYSGEYPSPGDLLALESYTRR